MGNYLRVIFLVILVIVSGRAHAQAPLKNGNFTQGEISGVPKGWFVPAVCEQAGYGVKLVPNPNAGAAKSAKLVQMYTTGQPDSQMFGNLMQAFDATPYQGKRVRFRARIKAAAGSRAQVWLRVDREDGKMGFFDNMGDRPITAQKWADYDIIGDIDKNAKFLNVGCMLLGPGKIWIESASFTVVGADAKRTGRAAPGPGILFARGGYEFTATADVDAPKIAFPMPMEFEDQVPLTYDLKIEPPSAVKQVLYTERKPLDWVVEVQFNPVKKGAKITLNWHSDVLVRPRSYADLPKSVALAKLADAPDAVKIWLNKSRCVQTDHPEILAQAKRMREKDVLALARNVTTLPSSIKPGNFRTLDALEALRKNGSCTSMANLATAIFRANGVPTRILACYPTWSGPLQTHYIVQFYVPDYGWVWLESAIGEAPYLPYQDVITAIVYPEDEEKSFEPKRWSMSGVPYMTLTENLGSSDFTISKMLIAPEKDCDHVAGVVQRFEETDAKKWDAAFLTAQSVWRATLAQLKASETLSDALKAAQKSAATAATLDELATRLQACSTDKKDGKTQETRRVSTSSFDCQGKKKGASVGWEKPGWTLTFHDEFDGVKLDSKKWIDSYPDNARTHSNNEQQYYAEDGWEVKGGHIRFKAEKRRKGGMPYTSGMISSYGKFAQAFGWFEIRAKFPKGKGMWPAFWLLPESKAWPPEIDVLEILGHEPDKVYMTNHYNNAKNEHEYKGDSFKGPDFSADYHTFAVEWSPQAIVWYVDGKERYRTAENIPSVPMYVLANLAVGGDWPGMPDAKTVFPAYMDVDYIRVYKKKDAPTSP